MKEQKQKVRVKKKPQRKGDTFWKANEYDEKIWLFSILLKGTVKQRKAVLSKINKQMFFDEGWKSLCNLILNDFASSGNVPTLAKYVSGAGVRSQKGDIIGDWLADPNEDLLMEPEEAYEELCKYGSSGHLGKGLLAATKQINNPNSTPAEIARDIEDALARYRMVQEGTGEVPSKDWIGLKFMLGKFGYEAIYNQTTRLPELKDKDTGKIRGLGDEDGSLIGGIRARMRRSFTFNDEPWRQGADDFNEDLVELARKSKYNPMKDYFESCVDENDKKLARKQVEKELAAELLSLWDHRHTGKKGQKYAEFVSMVCWTNTVRRTLKPGCPLDVIPALCGETGISKSTFVKSMLPKKLQRYYLSSLKVQEEWDEKVVPALSKKSHGEWPEMNRSCSTETMKAKVLDGKDDVRLSYRRNSEEIKRQWSVIATLNPLNNLPDDHSFLRRMAFLDILMKDGETKSDLYKRIVAKDWSRAWGLAYLLVKKFGFKGNVPESLRKEHEKAIGTDKTRSSDMKEAMVDFVEDAFDGKFQQKQMRMFCNISLEGKTTSAFNTIFSNMVDQGLIVKQERSRLVDHPTAKQPTVYHIAGTDPKCREFVDSLDKLKAARKRFGK